MDCIAQCTRLKSLTFSGHIDSWVPLILQHLRILKLPLMPWGDWIEDLQLHQMSAFQIGSTVPSREILHFEELTHLDMHMPNDAIDSFSLHSLVLRGGELDTSLVQQIRIGCPLLRRLHLINVDIQANVMPALVDLDTVIFESCRIDADNHLHSQPEWTRLSFRGTAISDAHLAQCLTNRLRSLDVSHTQASMRPLLMNSNLINLECLWADGTQNATAFFDANALISLTGLSIRSCSSTVEEVLSKQALLSLQTLDLGDSTWGDLSLVNHKSLEPIKTLRISPHEAPMMLSDFKQRVRPSVVPRLVHKDPLLKGVFFHNNLET